MTNDDYRALSEQADEHGIFRLVLTGGGSDGSYPGLNCRARPNEAFDNFNTNGWSFDDDSEAFADIEVQSQISLA